MEHGFKSLNLHRISCGTTSDNIAMQKLVLSTGMNQEGVRKESIMKNGCYVNLIEYGVIR